MSITDLEKQHDLQMLTINCQNDTCLSKLRIGRFIKLPITRTGAMSFCPMCGSNALVRTDDDQDYWESLAQAYKLPVDVVVAIHSIWDSRECPVFADFVEHMKKEAEKIK